jgi:hypothetical protein
MKKKKTFFEIRFENILPTSNLKNQNDNKKS